MGVYCKCVCGRMFRCEYVHALLNQRVSDVACSVCTSIMVVAGVPGRASGGAPRTICADSQSVLGVALWECC